MKKTFLKIYFLLSNLVLTFNTISAQTISNHFFGQNAWMPAQIGNTVLNGKLDKNWGKIKESKGSIIRYGGIAADKDMPTNEQYIAIIDSIRANGMEPVIQVPFENYKYNAQQAAGIVHYINIVKGKKIQYWSIGNEPDLEYSYTNASQIAGYIKPFASAMKNIDPSIKIMGPECAWFNKAIMDGLTTPNGPDDITGQDVSGRYYLDIITFHTYPFNGSQTRDQVISKLTATGSFQDNLSYLNTRIAACNSTHKRTGSSAIKIAVTEANICYKNPAGDNPQGVGANSFIGGQFIAEMMGIGIKNSLDFMTLWSVVEGSIGGSTDIGYLEAATGNKKPTYYHFKMMAENFKGDYANCILNQNKVKAFASKSAQQVSVLLMNQELSGSFNYTIRLNNEAIEGINPLKINVNTGIAAEYAGSIDNQSSILLIFNTVGTLVKIYEYSLAGHAMANLAPTVTEFSITSIGETNNSIANGAFELKNIYPNPASGSFNLFISKGSVSDDQAIEVQIINILGQEVYKNKLKFETGKEEIHLMPSMANGEYIVRVKEGEKDNYLVKKLIVQQ